MPINKYASTYMNEAYKRLAAAVADMEPPAFTLFPTADQFEDAKQHVRDVAHLWDEYLSAVAVEANSNATININTKDRATLVSDAVHDSSLLDNLQEAADDLREGESYRSDRAEHGTYHGAP